MLLQSCMGEELHTCRVFSLVNSLLCMMLGHGCSLFVWQIDYGSLKTLKQHKADRRIMSWFNAFYLDRKSL